MHETTRADEERLREQNRLAQARWRERHPERNRVAKALAQAAWRARHPEQERANQAAKRAKVKRTGKPGWPHGAMRDPVAFGRKGGLARRARAA